MLYNNYMKKGVQHFNDPTLTVPYPYIQKYDLSS